MTQTPAFRPFGLRLGQTEAEIEIVLGAPAGLRNGDAIRIAGGRVLGVDERADTVKHWSDSTAIIALGFDAQGRLSIGMVLNLKPYASRPFWELSSPRY